MSKMIKFIKYSIACLLSAFLIFEGTCLGILLLPSGKYADSYQATIQDKFELLKNTDEPKIIFIAGSSGAFGLDAEALEEASGYKVVNLGLHAGFGFLFITELAKVNINSGDIVLLAYEYNWTKEDAFTQIGTDLVMSGIGDKLEMYRYVPVSQWKSIVGYLFTYAVHKNEYRRSDGVYSRDGFSNDGNQMIVERTETYALKPENIQEIQTDISEESVSYLKKFKDYVNEQGASVYFVAAPYVKGYFSNAEQMSELTSNEEVEIGIPYISDPEKYALSETLMFDTGYHCNSAGEKVRTDILIDDLKRASVIN